MRTELFENADVTASIYYVSEHTHGSLGIMQGQFDCLFSFIEVRTSKFACSSAFVWTGIFSKTLLVGTRIFFYTDKTDAFQSDLVKLKINNLANDIRKENQTFFE